MLYIYHILTIDTKPSFKTQRKKKMGNQSEQIALYTKPIGNGSDNITPGWVSPPDLSDNESDNDMPELDDGDDQIPFEIEGPYQTFANEFDECKTLQELNAKQEELMQNITISDAQLLDSKYHDVQGQYWRYDYGWPCVGDTVPIDGRDHRVTETGLLTFNAVILSCSCGMCGE